MILRGKFSLTFHLLLKKLTSTYLGNIIYISQCFHDRVMVTQVKFGRTRNAVETRAVGECFHSNFEFSQTFMSVTITLWKHRENVFYKIVFYEIKA